LDLLFFGQEIIDTETLTVPHPRLTGRAFVLGPMAELAPNFKHPAEGKSMRTLLEILGPDELAKIRLIRGN
jgi:2-amino-4-hydroxy-6-hydroxymethyldihydropteridine diphosphokinase